MFRLPASPRHLHLPLAKAPNARGLTILTQDSPAAKSNWKREMRHFKTHEPLYAVIGSRSTFVQPWKTMGDLGENGFAVPAPDGLIYPGPKWVQCGRKRRQRYEYALVENGFCIGPKEDSRLHFHLSNYFDITFCNDSGKYCFGREDDSPLQPHMWEISKGVQIPSSLRMITRQGIYQSPASSIVFGPAFPMSLDCLNQHLKDFMEDSGRVTPLRHWFTPEEEFCKENPEMIDFARQVELVYEYNGWLEKKPGEDFD